MLCGGLISFVLFMLGEVSVHDGLDIIGAVGDDTVNAVFEHLDNIFFLVDGPCVDLNAGGMGAALMAFLNAELRSGIEIVTEALKLEEQIHDCSLVVTGEGRLDSQSVHGKVPVGVARVAKKYRKPVIGIAGSLTHDVGVVHQHGIDAVFSVLTSVSTLEEAFRGAFDNIYRASRNIAATLQVGMTTEG